MISSINGNINKLITKAVSIRSMIDAKNKIGKYEIDKYADFLQNGIENPTGYLLVKSFIFNDNNVNFPAKYIRNMKKITGATEITNLQIKFNTMFQDNYPKTKFARKYIIKNHRINPYYTSETRGYNIFAKMKIATDIILNKIFNKDFKI